jgi:uncharacterized RDD family membrane protein YckC
MDSPPVPEATLLRRLGSLIYETLIVVALLLLAGLVFLLPLHALTGTGASDGWALWLFRAWIVAVLGSYFIWFWTRGGQTLPMRTWRLRVVDTGGSPIRLRRALCRYLLAWPSVLTAGAGLAWALVDRDRQFLHDRLAGTRLVRVEA